MQVATPEPSFAVSSVAPQLSCAQRAYADALHSVIKFLTLAEMVQVARCCRSWRSHASSLKSRGIEFVLKPNKNALLLLGSLCSSSLRHHVKAFGNQNFMSLASLRWLSMLPGMSRAHLLVSDTLERLMGAHWQLVNQSFPPTLTDVTLIVSENCPRDAPPSSADMARQNLAHYMLEVCARSRGIAALTLVTKARTHNQIELHHYNAPKAELNPELDLQPLLEFRSLTSLTLRFNLTADQVHVVRMLRFLRKLDVRTSQPNPVLLGQILRKPHDFKLLNTLLLNLPVVGGADLELLASLPSLARLPPSRLHSTALPRLANFRSLASLHLALAEAGQGDQDEEEEEDEDGNPIAPAMFQNGRFSAEMLLTLVSPCDWAPRLQQLYLEQTGAITAYELDLFWHRFEGLRCLTLSSVALPSLHFLKRLPLLEQLAVICSSSRLTREDLGVILAVPKLRHLHIVEQGVRVLCDDGDCDSLKFPSVRKPLLYCFQYSHMLHPGSSGLRVISFHSEHRCTQSDVPLAYDADDGECCLQFV